MRGGRWLTALLLGLALACCGAVAACAEPVAWHVMSSPRGGRGASLTGVSCATLAVCVAVGADGEGAPIAEVWHGRVWRDMPTPKVAPVSALSDVSCPAPDRCWAVGSKDGSGLIEGWDGTSWHLVSTPTARLALAGISCPSRSFCGAVGQSGRQSAVMFLRGTRWDLSYQDRGAQDISCVSAAFCEAVGSGFSTGGDTEAYAATWDGSSWRTSHAIGPPATQLFGVACWSAHGCMGVGWDVPRALPLAERWNGRTWSMMPVPHLGGVVLLHVSCVDARSCLAVGSRDGDRPVVAEWLGGSWTAVATPAVGHAVLSGAVLKGRTGVVVGVHDPELQSIAESGPVGR